jgi:hypothetical protein
MDLLGRMRAGTADHDTLAIFFPFQNGSRRKAELATYFCGDGDLPLSGQFR